MTTFYCVRHGKTEYNQRRFFQGGLVDSPLLPEGQEGARKAGKFLREIPFSEVLVSPQGRAQDTARLILEQHTRSLDITTVDDLREMEFGIWEGKPEKEFSHLEQFKNLVHFPHKYDPAEYQGESFYQLIERAKTVFENYATSHPDDDILIVSHGLTLQIMLNTLTGVPLSDIRKGKPLKNTSVSTILSNGSGFVLDIWNDTSFID
ncbi:histidine phosphatase family protein [Vagococcus elongatus]|uniref:Histidine phosphatase family protein n=1 Tax=Vagococcus elongatus TaxID=180344 RepID=A0A430B1A2_9ENTE|nr:histidine phosphatase family protein [Vagococcus elongatus]RSU14096.1 hypothetical protein CBF29_04225 [Vagococcus elongatus]